MPVGAMTNMQSANNAQAMFLEACGEVRVVARAPASVADQNEGRSAGQRSTKRPSNSQPNNR